MFSRDVVLPRELGLSCGNPPVLAVVAWSPLGSPVKGGRAVLEEQLLPAVKLSRQEGLLVARIGDRDFVDQVSFDDCRHGYFIKRPFWNDSTTRQLQGRSIFKKGTANLPAMFSSNSPLFRFLAFELHDRQPAKPDDQLSFQRLPSDHLFRDFQ